MTCAVYARLPVGRHLAVIAEFDQDADHLAPAERHAQAHPGLQRSARYAGRRAVVEQATQRRGQGEAQYGREGVGVEQAAILD